MEARAWLERVEERRGYKEVVVVSLYNSLEKFLSERKHGNGSVAGGACVIKGEKGKVPVRGWG